MLKKELTLGKFDIKPLAREDEPFLWEMLYLALFVPPGDPPISREALKIPELSRYVQGWGQPDDMGFKALDNGKPIGAVWIRLMTGVSRGYGYIDDYTPEMSTAILPEYRGKGIGKTLIKHLIKNMQSHYSGICLSVSTENPAVHLYQRMGFEVIGEESSSLIMVKWINR